VLVQDCYAWGAGRYKFISYESNDIVFRRDVARIDAVNAGGEPMAGIAIIPAVVLGCIYFPMALLAVAMKDSVMAANPLVVIPAIFKVPLEYLVAVVLLGTVFGARILGEVVIGIIFGPNAVATHSMAQLFAMFGARMFWGLAGVYLLTVNMRIMGLLYATQKEKLGW